MFFLLAATLPFLWLSDIHFNPMADPALVDKLAGAEPAQWASILDTSSSGFAPYGQDTNWPLFHSAIAESKKVQPDIAFTMVTGDLLAHHFREQFNRCAAVHSDAAFREFERKTVEFVARELKQMAPAAPVVVTLGNNDSDCGDYLLEPRGPFLQDTRAIVAKLAQVSNDSAFAKSWTASGSYSMPHPTLVHYQIIVINSVLFSARYRNSCGHDAGDPGSDLLKWLRATLGEAERQRKKVWLVYHIPPGIDGYATSHSKTIVPFWTTSYSDEFHELVARYAKTIVASFAGHTHLDDFRLVGLPQSEKSLVLMEPALSPNIGQNPAFRIVNFKSSGPLVDESTYFLVKPGWKVEYSFDREWALRRPDISNYEKLYHRIEQSPETRERWTRFYSVSHPEGGTVTPANFRAFYCASGNSTIAGYRACVSSEK
jgi:hypothetical protein